MKTRQRLIILITIVLLMFSCSKKYEKISYYDSGEVKEKFVFPSKTDFENNQNYVGSLYYKNGNIKNSTVFENGKREGEYLTYYPNGKLERLTMYRKGQKTGVDKCFSIEGDIVEEDVYINDVHMTKMKSFNSNQGTINFYYYVEKDTLVENGRLIFDNQNKVIPEKSFYYYVNAKDTLFNNEDYIFEIVVYSFGEDNLIKEFLIGDFDENYNFVDSTSLIKLSSSTNKIKYSFKPAKKGKNFIMGKIYMESASMNYLKREFIFYDDFYVIDLPK